MPETTFRVDPRELGTAIGRVSTEVHAIRAGITRTRATFDTIEDDWISPSGTSFGGLATQFISTSDELMALFDDAVGRMRTAHGNYTYTEAVNTGNYQ